MKSSTMSACVAGACALAAITATASGHGGGHHPVHPSTPKATKALAAFTAQTTTLLRSTETRSATGVVHLRQRGSRLTGYVVMWGLEPGSTHANHIHGTVVGAPSPARCFPDARRSTRHILDRPDLVADSAGVAFAVINAKVPERTVRRGAYLMVHAHPTAAGGHRAAPGTVNPPIACGNLK